MSLESDNMHDDQPRCTEWPFNKEWASSDPPPPFITPVLTIEVSILELQTSIELHERMAISNHSQHDHEGALLHRVRASYLREQLAKVAPHLRTIGGRPTLSFAGSLPTTEGRAQS